MTVKLFQTFYNKAAFPGVIINFKLIICFKLGYVFCIDMFVNES